MSSQFPPPPRPPPLKGKLVKMPPSKTLWERTRTGGKAGFDKAWGWMDKLGGPVNRLSNKLGSEAFWPTTLDRESDKAARILRSFCKDGFYEEEEIPNPDGPKQKQKVIKKIPTEVIRNAKGLAIFTTMRSGLWISGAGGSGVLVGRMADGSWSPPSGILLHTAGLGFLVGVDIYDCVIVINTEQALQAFSSLRLTLGGEISAVAGPVGAGGIVDTELAKRQAPLFTYLKSRGFYAGVQVDGTIVVERTDENERFYNERIPVADILAGKIRHPPYELKMLMETLKAAEGSTNVDEQFLPSEPAPGDYEIDDGTGSPLFSVPDKEDPDPYGVRALEQEGIAIREAGSQARVSGDNFEFRPSPTSPIFHAFNRNSIDMRSNASHSRRSSWRTSTLAEQQRPATTMMDSSTQTELPPENTSVSRSPEIDNGMFSHGHGPGPVLTNGHSPHMADIPETTEAETVPTDTTKAAELGDTDDFDTIDIHEHSTTATSTADTDDKIEKDEKDEADETEPITTSTTPAEAQAATFVQRVQTTAVPQVISKARLVTVQKRTPPKLPPRNPERMRPVTNSAAGPDDGLDGRLSPSYDRPNSVRSFRSALSTHTDENNAPSAEEERKDSGLSDNDSTEHKHTLVNTSMALRIESPGDEMDEEEAGFVHH